MIAKKILIVEDEIAIREMIRTSLEMAGFECLEAGDAQDAHIQLVDNKPDLVLLDWMLPGNSGLELIRRMKRDTSIADVPVIMLTARTDEDNKIQGLNSGADDYVTKPFSVRELIARIKALLRRSASSSDNNHFRMQGLQLDDKSHRVYIDDEAIDIGPTEYKLLRFFMANEDRAFSRSQILDNVWGGNVYIEERTVDVHIRRLRNALRRAGTSPIDYGLYIQTVRGTGYRFSSLVIQK